MSVEDTGVWKPARGPYEYAGTDLWRRRARHAACSRASLGRRRRRPRRDADGVDRPIRRPVPFLLHRAGDHRRRHRRSRRPPRWRRRSLSALSWRRYGRPRPFSGPLAQLAEQRTFNPRVRGSIPRRPTPSDLCFCRMNPPNARAWCQLGGHISPIAPSRLEPQRHRRVRASRESRCPGSN